jgi:hypothetical protein
VFGPQSLGEQLLPSTAAAPCLESYETPLNFIRSIHHSVKMICDTILKSPFLPITGSYAGVATIYDSHTAGL